MLIDTNGNIVYSAVKGNRPGRQPAHRLLPDHELRRRLPAGHAQATSVDQVFITDFESYAPAYGVPTPWVLTPIGDTGGIHGALALQLRRKRSTM